MRAATVDAVLVPAPRIHERLDEQPERVGFVQLELLEQVAERFGDGATNRLWTAVLAPYQLGRLTTYSALGAVAGGLKNMDLHLAKDTLTLEVPARKRALLGETVGKRLDEVAEAFGRKGVVGDG